MAASSVDQQTQEEVRAAFEKGSAGSGRLDNRGLAVALRWLGQNPDQNEISHLMGKFGGGGSLDQNQFMDLWTGQSDAASDEAALMEAFQVFDKDGKGILSAAELRHILGNLGDKLTEEEVQGMCAEALDGQPTLNYHTFVSRMMGRR